MPEGYRDKYPTMPKIDLNELQRWEQLWDTDFNPSKCAVMHITRARHPANNQYTMHNQILPTADIAATFEWTSQVISISILKSIGLHLNVMPTKP